MGQGPRPRARGGRGRSARAAWAFAAGLAVTGAPLGAHPLCGVDALLDVSPRDPADGATLDYTLRICDVGTNRAEVLAASLPADLGQFVPGSIAWTDCPPGNCSLGADGVLRIGAFALAAGECVPFHFTARLQPGLRGREVCEEGAMSTLLDGNTVPCDRPTDDWIFNLGPTCARVLDPEPGCRLVPEIQPGFYSGCAGVATQLSAGGSSSSGCPGGLGYQWLRNGVELAGETAATLDLPAGTPPSSASYRVRVSCAALPGCVDLSPGAQVVLSGPGEIDAPGAVCAGVPTLVQVPGGATCSIDCGNGAPPVGACVANCAWATAGSYTIRARADDPGGCHAEPSRPIEVLAAASACIDDPGAVCERRTTGPTEVRLSSCSPPGVGLAWSASLGSFDDPSAVFPVLTLPDVAVATRVDVGLTASAPGCGAPAQAAAALTLLPAPLASFTTSRDATCDNLITFTPTAIDPAYDYAWDFGDGASSTSPAPSHAYDRADSFTPTLTVTERATGCSASLGLAIRIDRYCCAVTPPAVAGVMAVRSGATDLVLSWQPQPEATGGYDTWFTSIKENIPTARSPGGPGYRFLCPGSTVPSCLHFNALPPSPTSTLNYYQVRGVCGGYEGE